MTKSLSVLKIKDPDFAFDPNNINKYITIIYINTDYEGVNKRCSV